MYIDQQPMNNLNLYEPSHGELDPCQNLWDCALPGPREAPGSQNLGQAASRCRRVDQFHRLLGDGTSRLIASPKLGTPKVMDGSLLKIVDIG